jgi:ADP-ribosylglycohydrolase
MLDKFKGTIWGLSCGDALGAPTEFCGMDTIKRRWGPSGIQDLSQTSGKFTDDTQMAVAVAEGLLNAHAERPGRIAEPGWVMPFIAEQFVNWAFGPDNDRAPGGTCMAGCQALRNGTTWRKSGVPMSKGCGSAMRAAPMGLFYSNRAVLGVIARSSSIMTHGHPVAVEAAHVAALCVRLILDGETEAGVLLAESAEVVSDEGFLALLERVPEAIRATIEGEAEPEEIMRHNGSEGLGESWVGDEAVASALYCYGLAAARGEGYVETVRYGANTNGDSDSIAAIAGSLAGARWGLGGTHGVPKTWVEHVEDSTYLGELAERLNKVSATLVA